MAWKLNDEPAAVFGALGELVRQAIPVLVALGVWALSKEQLVIIMLFVSASVTFLTVLFTRRATVTTETANSQIKVALSQPSSTSVDKVIEIAAAKSTGDGK